MPTTRPSPRPPPNRCRRALAIQLIINREWGLAKNENPNQGSFIIDELTDLVEEAVLQEFERISERGGVLGAMETGYQRGKIQEESLYYEHRKHDGSYPIIGVNTFRNRTRSRPAEASAAAFDRGEKRSQIRGCASPEAQRHRGAGCTGETEADRDRQRQRVRRTGERRALLLARPDYGRVVRSRRAVPQKHVAGAWLPRVLKPRRRIRSVRLPARPPEHAGARPGRQLPRDLLQVRRLSATAARK